MKGREVGKAVVSCVKQGEDGYGKGRLCKWYERKGGV